MCAATGRLGQLSDRPPWRVPSRQSRGFAGARERFGRVERQSRALRSRRPHSASHVAQLPRAAECLNILCCECKCSGRVKETQSRACNLYILAALARRPLRFCKCALDVAIQ